MTTIAKRAGVIRGLLPTIAVACCMLVLAIGTGAAQQAKQSARTNSVIERIVVSGTRRVSMESLRERISSRPGEPYNAQAVEGDAHALRSTGFFDQVRAKVENTPRQPNGKIVIFYVVERPIIGPIEYKGISSMAEEEIVQAYKRRSIRLSAGAYFDPAELPRAAAAVKDLLTAQGYPAARVKTSVEGFPRKDEVNIVFNVAKGPKAKSK